jgi:hypothetical protein
VKYRYLDLGLPAVRIFLPPHDAHLRPLAWRSPASADVACLLALHRCALGEPVPRAPCPPVGQPCGGRLLFNCAKRRPPGSDAPFRALYGCLRLVLQATAAETDLGPAPRAPEPNHGAVGPRSVPAAVEWPP